VVSGPGAAAAGSPAARAPAPAEPPAPLAAAGAVAPPGASSRPRAVLLVANTAAPYSRSLRVARSLAAAGWDVEIAAVAGGGLPREERDARDPSIVTRRHAPSGMFRGWSTADSETMRGPLTRYGRIGRLLDSGLKAILWPLTPRGWWRAVERDVAPADLYHAFGILTVPVALRMGRRARSVGRGGRGAGGEALSAGRAGRVVYDVIDVVLESNNVARVPRPLLAWYRWRERRWAHRADAIVTVNDPITDHLHDAWRLRTRPTVLLNCQPRWTPADPRPDLIREASGLPADRRVVLFLGRLGRERGLDAAADAVLRVSDAALVMLGFGPWSDRLRERDRDPRYAGHHVTLPAVPPDDVPAWTASADVSIVAVPANSLNQRLSTPNKFWESLTAGTPVVVGRDLEVMRAIVEADRLGAVADPADPDDLARALSALLDAPPEERDARRARCLAVSRDRYSWEVAVEPYVALVETLAPAS
jgi:glycosyltransferase involved in cell wall biosynthesis